MQINPLLQKDIQDFIDYNLKTNVADLALQKNPFPNVNWIDILNQINAKQKAKSKLPTWFDAKNIIYPAKISIEQTSSEKTAEYKSKLVSGESLIDLTGGFGIDDYYFSKKLKEVIHCEINEELSQIVAHNFEQLMAKNIQCLAGDSYQMLQNLNQKLDWIYIDPSRRNEAKGKVFMLKDCLPNVPEYLDFYFEYASNIMIKTAPILDITAGLLELKNVKTIHIVAVENEVKELLWVLEKNYSQPIRITASNILKNKTEEFSFDHDTECLVNYSLPKKYIYEPNAAIMKSGGFDEIAMQFKIDKLQQHSHLYTSDTLQDFPGRIFEIQNCIGYNKTDMKQFMENKKANITTRNFPDTVENIRKKWKIAAGGNLYCFFTTDVNNNKIVLLCDKLK
ncbi:THUMP-like domain-containing protein [Flavobacterium sp. RSB2_4_14]|uniref:THUMP-like domain-containing protein n=1 Tax=Flavobacterium sp. RSB2_4_14 TaxID=3447665 RepID=UPI003F3913B3